jgi:mRNA-degrading endonuclease RelE of RelBE toxin-antitoxin system
MEKADKKISPTEQAMGTPPPFVFYSKFYKDWDRFPDGDRRAIRKFLELLQEKYDDPEYQQRWEQSGKYWAARIPEIGYRVFWTVVYPEGAFPSIIAPRAEEIHILVVEPIPRERR